MRDICEAVKNPKLVRLWIKNWAENFVSRQWMLMRGKRRKFCQTNFNHDNIREWNSKTGYCNISPLLSPPLLSPPAQCLPQIPSDKEFVFEVAPKFTIFIFLSLSHSISALTFYIFTTQKKLKVFFTLCKFSFSLTPPLRHRMMKRKREKK